MTWTIKRIKDIKSSKANAFADGPFGSNLKTEHFVDDGDVLVIDSGYITSGNFAIHREFKTITFEHFLTVKRSECKDGDLIIAKIGANFGMSAILPKLDKPSLVSGNTLKLTINKKLYFNKFIHYQFLNKKTLGEIDVLVKGSAQPALSMGLLNDIEFILPNSLCKQQAIANYLDAKTQAIDKKISLLEQKIETYKKLKRTLINQTITKGLDKNVPLKDSDISWIGQIPQHWEVKRLKELGNIETSSINKKIEKDEDLVKLVNYTDVYSNLKREIWNNDNYMIVSANKLQISSKKLKQGDVLFTPSSETINDIGVSAVVMENLHNTLYSYHLLRLRFKKVVDLHFKKYLFSNDYVQYYFSKSATGTTRKILGLNTFNNLIIPLPPKPEQEEIAKYLDHKTATIDAIVGNIGKQIETLKQLRKTLINDVVTGKIKVVDI